MRMRSGAWDGFRSAFASLELEVASASTTGAQVDSCDKIAPRQASLPTGSRQVLGACT